jgi:hypothetical protein
MINGKKNFGFWTVAVCICVALDAALIDAAVSTYREACFSLALATPGGVDVTCTVKGEFLSGPQNEKNEISALIKSGISLDVMIFKVNVAVTGKLELTSTAEPSEMIPAAMKSIAADAFNKVQTSTM